MFRMPSPSRTWQPLLAVLCLLAGPPALSGQGSGATPLEGGDLKQARSLYRAKCAGCHGRRGTSRAATGVDFTDARTAARLRTGDSLELLLADRGAGHPAVNLAPDARAAIAAYIREQLLPAP
jgi:mono/diheme cytochrome c family protein